MPGDSGFLRTTGEGREKGKENKKNQRRTGCFCQGKWVAFDSNSGPSLKTPQVPRFCHFPKWAAFVKGKQKTYRTNYFIMIVFILGLGFFRKPLAIVAALLTALSIAFLNDSFAGTFNEKVTRTVRQFSPHLAAKMRPPLMPVIRGRPSAKRTIHVCGRPRWVFVLLSSAASFILWFVSSGLLSVLLAFAIGLLATLIHASFRTPNLKARLNTFREEFRAVWRNYSEL
ncbi:PRA1 family protein A3 [Abeliophyllum distichum]|uniref:PRA1 family protein n=1 Tax=Abeliophyllum distichum TaxID=126358 RepID=A0ABD1V8W8_9LAMI